MEINDLLPADVILVYGNLLFDRVVQHVTHSKYSHVAIVADKPEYVIEAQEFSRVHYQDTGAYIGHADVFRCDLLDSLQRDQLIKNAEKHLNQRYDYLLVFIEFIRYTLGVMLPYYEHNSVICSTLVSNAYKSVGVDLCEVKYPSPADIAKSGVLRYQGPLVG